MPEGKKGDWQMTRVEMYFHIVWATQYRQPLLTPQKETAAFRCMLKLIAPTPYDVIALNGMPDHVHLLVQTGPQVDLSALMKRVKAVSSALLNDMTDHQERFRWQEGYSSRSISLSHFDTVISYIHNQKQHHADNTTHPSWEECDINE